MRMRQMAFRAILRQVGSICIYIFEFLRDRICGPSQSLAVMVMAKYINSLSLCVINYYCKRICRAYLDAVCITDIKISFRLSFNLCPMHLTGI